MMINGDRRVFEKLLDVSGEKGAELARKSSGRVHHFSSTLKTVRGGCPWFRGTPNRCTRRPNYHRTLSGRISRTPWPKPTWTCRSTGRRRFSFWVRLFGNKKKKTHTGLNGIRRDKIRDRFQLKFLFLFSFGFSCVKHKTCTYYKPHENLYCCCSID